ncbi:hypothetical protein BH11MYX3_BH11MYX3_05320 [soil metagenome]
MRRVVIACVLIAGCGNGAARVEHPEAAHAQLSLAADDRMVLVPEGKFIAGSTLEERGAAYDDYQAATSTDAARERKWFDREEDRHQITLPAFKIDLMPVTQSQYAELVATGKVPAPAIDQAAWQAQGFSHDFATEVMRFVWKASAPPGDRLDHPVVLVTWDEANRYCAWRGELRGEARRLPTAAEYEKAARGDGGVAYPWGNVFDPTKLNTADRGPGDTVPTGTFTAGASPYGVLDMAGNVVQWTSTPDGPGMMLVKGSAWDDHAGQGRAAAAQGHKTSTRHVVIGFRCAAPP